MWTGEGPSRHLKEIQEKYTYVPILKMLESLLKCPAVHEEVKSIASSFINFITRLAIMAS